MNVNPKPAKSIFELINERADRAIAKKRAEVTREPLSHAQLYAGGKRIATPLSWIAPAFTPPHWEYPTTFASTERFALMNLYYGPPPPIRAGGGAK